MSKHNGLWEGTSSYSCDPNACRAGSNPYHVLGVQKDSKRCDVICERKHHRYSCIETLHQCCSQSSPGIELVDGDPPAFCNVKPHDVVAESDQTLLARQKRNECYPIRCFMSYYY